MSPKYQGMQRAARDIAYANRTGNCPVCKYRPHGWWPDGIPRILCGDPSCEKIWLPGGNQAEVAHDVGEVEILEVLEA